MLQEKKINKRLPKSQKQTKRLTKTIPPNKGPNPDGIYAPLKPEYYL
jgi:hypothetical protein